MSENIEERIAAWLDGALSADQARSLEAELANNPELAAKAAAWKANDAFIAAALHPLVETPIDPAMLTRLGLVDKHLVPAPANDNLPWWRRHAVPLGGAIAASIAALALIAVPRPPQPDALSLALDTTPSLHRAVLADGKVIEPLLTVQARDGRWCREFRSGEDTSLACRSGKFWRVESSAKGTGTANSGEIGLASGADSKPLDGVYRKIGASDPVSTDREAALIAGKWNER